MATVLRLYLASVKEFVRDRASLFWTMAFPLIFIVIFGLIYGNTSNTPAYTVGLVNQDSGPVGTELVQIFGHKPFIAKVGSYDAEMAALKQGSVDMMLVIPSDASASVQSGGNAGIQMYYDPSTNPTDAQIKLTLVQSILAQVNQQYAPYHPPLVLQTNSITAQSSSPMSYLIPGILAMAIMQLGLFGTATPLVSLREEQVLRRLGATPLPRWQLLASQVMLRLSIGIVQAAIIIGLSVAMFKVQIPMSSLPALTGMVLLGALAFVALGYFIASIAKSVESVSGISSALSFPMMFLSGIFFPLTLLPAFLAPVVKALPLTYLADAFRQISFGSTPAFPLSVDVAVLVAWVIGCAFLAARLFKWE